MCSGEWKDVVSSFILLTLLQFLYTLAITDQDKKRWCNNRYVDERRRALQEITIKKFLFYFY